MHLFNLKKTRLRGVLVAVCSYLMGGYREVEPDSSQKCMLTGLVGHKEEVGPMIILGSLLTQIIL